MRLAQLRQMDLAEISERGRQQATKWLDRAGTPISMLSRPRLTAAGEPDAVVGHRFFESAVSSSLPTVLTERMPWARDAVVAIADNARRHRFDLLGYTNLSFGEPVDWHFDPVSNRRTRPIHWSRLQPLDHAANGDSKVIWELNRHQWLVQMGLAYRLTGDERYAEYFADSIERWMQANRPGMGINWASSLEASFRLIAWCWSLRLFHGAHALSPRLRRAMVDGIGTHAAHVERYLSTYFSPNTHLTGEALGLVYAGVLLPGSSHTRRWKALGERILIEQCSRHVLPDGVYFEQATGYERYTLEFYLHLLLLRAAERRPAPPAVTRTINHMLDFLLAIRRPDGSLPQIGDADSGSLLPLVPRAQEDFRGVFAVAAALLGRADCAWAAGGAAPELLWLLGPAGLSAFDRIRPAPPRLTPSRRFADGGYVVMQPDWSPNRHQLLLDAGPLGCGVTGGHGHADLLSIQCSVFGEPYVVDAGTFVYTGDTASRTFFRETAAHSTVMVDGRSQAISTGPFRWSARPAAALRSWRSTPLVDFADATHAAYAGLPGDIQHRRRVAFVKSRYWLIADDLSGGGSHTVDVRFQFAPMDVTLDGAGRALARGRSGGALLVQAFSRAPLQPAIYSGCDAPMQGWVSRAYGRREPAPLLSYSTTATLPVRVVTLFLPLSDPNAALPAFAPIYEAGGTVTGVRFEDGERAWFDSFGVHVERAADSPRPPL